MTGNHYEVTLTDTETGAATITTKFDNTDSARGIAMLNGAPAGYPSTSVYRTSKLVQAWSPMCYLLWEPDENALGPGNPGAFDYNDGGNFPNASEGIGRLHSRKGGSILALAGHVQFVSREKFRAESTGLGLGPGGKSFLWWSPFSVNGH